MLLANLELYGDKEWFSVAAFLLLKALHNLQLLLYSFCNGRHSSYGMFYRIEYGLFFLERISSAMLAPSCLYHQISISDLLEKLNFRLKLLAPSWVGNNRLVLFLLFSLLVILLL